MKREYDFAVGRRGADLKTPPGKSRITIRLDDDVRPILPPHAGRTGARST